LTRVEIGHIRMRKVSERNMCASGKCPEGETRLATLHPFAFGFLAIAVLALAFLQGACSPSGPALSEKEAYPQIKEFYRVDGQPDAVVRILVVEPIKGGTKKGDVAIVHGSVNFERQQFKFRALFVHDAAGVTWTLRALDTGPYQYGFYSTNTVGRWLRDGL
jgi:hypothetical protein